MLLYLRWEPVVPWQPGDGKDEGWEIKTDMKEIK